MITYFSIEGRDQAKDYKDYVDQIDLNIEVLNKYKDKILREMKKLTDQQHFYIKTIYLYLKEHGKWPTYGYVEQCFLNTYPDTEVEDVEKSLPDSLTNGKPVRWLPDFETELTIKAIHLLPDASNDLADFIRVVRYCATKYVEAGKEQHEITSETAKQDLHMSDFAIAKVGQLLRREHNIFFVFTTQKNGWACNFIRGIRRFRNITSIEQYLEKQEELEETSDLNEPSLIKKELTMSDKQESHTEKENKNNISVSPWKDGSFYLITFVVIIAAIGVVASVVPWYAFPVVLIASIIIGSIIGTLQFRQNNKLSEKNFVELMSLYFKSLFLLKGRNGKSESEEIK